MGLVPALAFQLSELVLMDLTFSSSVGKETVDVSGDGIFLVYPP